MGGLVEANVTFYLVETFISEVEVVKYLYIFVMHLQLQLLQQR